MAGGNRGREELRFKPDTGEEKGKKERERDHVEGRRGGSGGTEISAKT